MSIKASRFYGIGLAALTIGAFAACSSDDTTPPPSGSAGTSSTAGTGTGGTSSTAGTGTGGSTTAGTGTGGSATAGTGTGGTGGGAGGSGTGPFACSGTKPTAALITSFADTMPKAGTPAGDFTFTAGLAGGTYRYPTTLTLDATGMALNVKGAVGIYSGIGLYFNDCIDAGTAGTTGVSFKIKATSLGTNTAIEFRVQTNSTQPVDLTNKKGACPGTGYPDCIDNGKTMIPVTAAESEVTVLWADLMGGMKGTAPAPFDAKEISGLQWVLPWAEGADYMADVTVDEVKFVGGTFTGGGGTGGTGGTGGGGGGGAGGGGAGGGGAGGGGTGGTGGTN